MEPRRLSRAAHAAIDRAERVGLSAMSVFEMVDLAERRRVQLDRPARAWVNAALEQTRVEVLPLTASIALDAGQLRFTGDPFDRVIYATARAEDALLVTRDDRMHAFDAERAIW